MSGPLRVLVLPGYTQNAIVYSKKMGAIRKILNRQSELVYIDPPHIVKEPTFGSSGFDSTATSANSSNPEEIPRAWWLVRERNGEKHWEGLDETFTYLKNIFATQGPFHAVWGFSQGATMAAILAAMLVRPDVVPGWSAPPPSFEGTWPPPPFLFTVCVAGFLPTDAAVRALFAEPVPAKTLHVLGRGDTIVGTDRSLPLVDAFVDPRIEWHDGGHHTPSKASWRSFFKDYLASFPDGEQGSDAIVGPLHRGGSGAATPTTGTATPTTQEPAGGKL